MTSGSHFRAAAVFWAAMGVGLAWGGAGVEGTSNLDLLERERQIKQDVEETVQKNILDPILGKGRAMVIADVELEILSQEQTQRRQGIGSAEKYKEKQGEGGGFQTQYVLPGVPKPRSVLGGINPEKPELAQGQQAQQEKRLNEQRMAVKPILKRFQVTVFHDDRVSRDKIDLVRQRILDALSQYQVKAGQIVFKPTRFSGNPWDVLAQPGVFVPLIFALLLFLLLTFLFGPLSSFLRGYVRALQENRGTEVEVDSKFEGGAGQEGGAGKEALMNVILQRKREEEKEEEDEMKKKFEPFVYIAEENLKPLAYLMMKQEPWVGAVILSYLKPEWARRVISILPIEFQAKVALESATIRQVTREQVEAIDAEIKEQVNFVRGGAEQLCAMLEEAEETAREHILEYLRNEKPALYERVRRAILTFEDIPKFPDREMQTVVRELKTEEMAKALRQSSPEMMNKFLSNMSTGAAALLKEAVEYTQEVSPAQAAEAKKKIMDVVKQLEKEGKIVVRQKSDQDLQGGLEEEISASEAREKKWGPGPEPAAGSGPGGAQPYFEAGAAYYEAGRYEECLPYFQYALSQDPSLWQAHQYLGGALYALGRTAEAVGHYEELVRLNPDPALKEWVENFKVGMKG